MCSQCDVGLSGQIGLWAASFGFRMGRSAISGRFRHALVGFDLLGFFGEGIPGFWKHRVDLIRAVPGQGGF